MHVARTADGGAEERRTHERRIRAAVADRIDVALAQARQLRRTERAVLGRAIVP